ncbi:MAG TPA: hypothetical protein VHT28_08910 [Silvibacterium sp.]|jgi:hypothetical protein|nr:hypothetical protein [Silvibacterium sp.]
MKRLFRQNRFWCFLALFGAVSYGKAQTAPTIDSDQPSTTAIAIAPPFGPAQVGIVSTGGAVFGLQEKVEVVRGQPYQAQAVTEMKQTLADGSHIVQTTTATVARDSDGRTVRIQKLSKIGPWKSSSDSSEGSSATLTSILDPVAKTHIDYTSDTKVAHVLPMPPSLPKGAVTTMANGFALSSEGPDGPVGPRVNFVYSQRAHVDSPDANNTKTEPLGAKSIEGVPVNGTRSTDTIPVGTIGNEKDIVITRETWYSPDLKLVIQSTQDDPRFGQSTYSLTNIQRDEPDETLFQVPAGYTIEKPHVLVKQLP